MKSLPTLLRIARRNLDLLRRMLADQVGKAIAVEERIAAHDQALRAEQSLAARDYESTRAYGGFAAISMTQRRGLVAEKEAIEQECGRLRGVIGEAHVEVRKFERLLELHEERERNAARKREDAELDELATLRAGRTSPR